MKRIRTQDAVGQTLCHDVTQIIRGVTKGVAFRKGHVINKSDITDLLNLGKDHVFIWETAENMLHENDAAQLLCELCKNENMTASAVREGKIELFAEAAGFFMIDAKKLRAINSLGEISIATRFSGSTVKQGDKLCGMRVIPLAIDKSKIEMAYKAAGDEPILRLLPLKRKRYGLIITGNEVFHGRIKDTFTPVIQDKLSEYGCEMIAHEICDDDHHKITAAIWDMLAKGVEMVFCTGGMSVDPDDMTPLAIRNAAKTVVSYGSPVMPGAVFMLAYTDDGRPICGLPGCIMYAKRTIFDLVLPRLLADVPVTAEWIASLGNGGLCLNCEDCHFPNCSFGKGT